jgi:hypothetical protein
MLLRLLLTQGAIGVCCLAAAHHGYQRVGKAGPGTLLLLLLLHLTPLLVWLLMVAAVVAAARPAADLRHACS